MERQVQINQAINFGSKKNFVYLRKKEEYNKDK
jgi:hypothetical protein